MDASIADYREFLVRKSQIGGEHGFIPTFHHPMLHDFQAHLVDWACRQGRAALFEDCGLGKGPQCMAWAQNVIEHENRPVLIAAPLSVSLQFVHEGNKFGFDVKRSLDGTVPANASIVTTNYERLERFDPDDFAGVVCDESSCIKNFDGSRKSIITAFMRKVKYRLLCSATPSPNDYIELGTSSEALGYLGYMDMLGMFFKNDEDSLHPAFIGSKWRFKHHAERDFWRWMCSWARAVRKPSDIGFSDDLFALPPLYEIEHVIESERREGELFAMPTQSLSDELAERRQSVERRCEVAAKIIVEAGAGVAWCQRNDEAAMLADMIPSSVEIAGSQSDEVKEELFEAFRVGQIQRLVSKPRIAALGLNWAHHNTATYFPDHSFEQYYQAVRRMYRYGQTRPVTIHNVTTQALSGVTRNLKRKTIACEEMFARMVAQMSDALRVRRLSEHSGQMEMPKWLR